MSDRITLETGELSATVALAGAELVGLTGADGAELLWQGGAEWPRRAPVLFPIVGRLAGDTLRHAGRSLRMTQHGFARDSLFRLVEATGTRAVLRLEDDERTRALFPFAFRLELAFAAEGPTLAVTATVTNPGTQVLPFGLGAHPGFRWPLVDGVPKHDHAIEFGAAESGEALSVRDGLLGPPRPIPLRGTVLPLSEALFADDALVLPSVRSRSLRYVARNADGSTARALRFSWEGYRDLGLWSKPGGASFLCVEPWYSMASPEGWDGEFADKPGLAHLAPGEHRAMTWRVTL
ncbi:aldose 1-epimerase family protein [Aureimonas flava]|uniref:Aldose 1-epimerase family protein n=1 Tax=Aureimonas flava TaxID=2320271 RepID=A0A3A1WPH9_9HYPH|nr:aldose 1-epimerase family protein [Aureimonas flava]RIY02645.1 aldose 1-epimerase family protein [Aureimonas flava]